MSGRESTGIVQAEKSFPWMITGSMMEGRWSDYPPGGFKNRNGAFHEW